MQSLWYFCTLSLAKNPTMCSQTIECCVGVGNWSSQLQLKLFYGASLSFFVNKTKTEEVKGQLGRAERRERWLFGLC